MANRPTMKQLQTNDRKQDERLDKLEEEVKGLRRREIIGYLREKNIPGSPKFRYTYEEIANLVGLSTTVVANIAKEEGLSRRLYSAI
jgi:hypothetical protein